MKLKHHEENPVMSELGGPGGPLTPAIFGRSVNHIPTGVGRLFPPILLAPQNFFTFRHHWVDVSLMVQLSVE